jgi:hypothetical protein
MPYIEQHRRDQLLYEDPVTAGELNYELTMTCLEYLGEIPTYQGYNDVIGALECAKLEFYRRRVSAYEDWKMAENGDVY